MLAVNQYQEYEHLDFSLGLDAHRLVYPTVLKLFREVDYVKKTKSDDMETVFV